MFIKWGKTRISLLVINFGITLTEHIFIFYLFLGLLTQGYMYFYLTSWELLIFFIIVEIVVWVFNIWLFFFFYKEWFKEYIEDYGLRNDYRGK